MNTNNLFKYFIKNLVDLSFYKIPLYYIPIAISFYFGPSEMSTKSVLDLVKKMAQYWPMVNWNLEEMINDFHESALLKLNCDLANELLKWFPKLDFESTTKMTALWYKNYYDSETSNIKEFTSKQINDYMNLNSGQN